MICRPREYLNADGMPPVEMLRSVMEEHLYDMPRLEQLGRYYDGKNTILNRERSEGLPNNRISHAYARYIVSVSTGYLVGQPVAYTTAEPNDTMDEIKNIFKRGAVSSVDIENARNAAIYGRGIEYVHVDNGGIPHASALNPKSAFVVYDDTYDVEPMFGVYFIRKVKADGTEDGFQVWVANDRYIYTYHCETVAGADYLLLSTDTHYFGGVPIVEYWNDELEKGDFEWVIPLIDAYDKLESDRVNDKEEFVDRLLLLTGCTLETDNRGREPWRQLREDKALCLPDSDAHATYLYTAMDESGNQILRNSIVEDIHKMSMIPDLTDQNFAQNASGVAMRFKLWGLEQLTNVKQQWFTEGLKSRLKLIISYLELTGKPSLDIADVKITFSRALPTNQPELAGIVQVAAGAGAMSLETKIKTLHAAEEWTDDDVQKEIELIKKDNAEMAKMASEAQQSQIDAAQQQEAMRIEAQRQQENIRFENQMKLEAMKAQLAAESKA